MEIEDLIDDGNIKFDAGHISEALELFEKALGQIEDAEDDWQTSSWLFAIIGDCYFLLNNFQKALDNFQKAYSIGEYLDNAFVVLRIGQCFYECNDKSKAKEYLLRAYMLDGSKIFNGEHNKYFNLIKTII